MKKFLSFDPITKVEQTFHSDFDGENFVIETKHDVTDIVEQNKARFAATDERARWGELTQIASIPMPLYFDLIARGVIDKDGHCNDDQALLRFLSDPANAHFRTRPGRLI
jgi:hypothetical protein